MVSKSERSEAPTNDASGYRFDRLRIGLVLRDMHFSKDDPRPGDRVPDFDLPTLEGGRFRSGELAQSAPVLMVFGSYTCPVTESAAAGLNRLHARFGDRVRFVIVNVREAHPDGTVPQPKAFDEKREHARLLCDLHGFDFEVAVDDIDGTLHRALSPKPNSAYLLGTDRTIVFRAHWANSTKAIAGALEAVTAGRPLRRTESRATIRSIMRTMRYVAPVLDRAGRGAWSDMWRAAPPMAAVAYMMRLARLSPRSS